MSLREVEAEVLRRWEIATGQRDPDETHWERAAAYAEDLRAAERRRNFVGPPQPLPPIDPEIGF